MESAQKGLVLKCIQKCKLNKTDPLLIKNRTDHTLKAISALAMKQE